MCLSGEGRRGGCACRADKASRRGGEADVRFREMKLSNIMPPPLAVSVALGNVGRGDGQFGGDFAQRRLGARQTELVLEHGGLGRISVRVGQIQTGHGINQLLSSRLSLLHQVREIEHVDNR